MIRDCDAYHCSPISPMPCNTMTVPTCRSVASIISIQSWGPMLKSGACAGAERQISKCGNENGSQMQLTTSQVAKSGSSSQRMHVATFIEHIHELAVACFAGRRLVRSCEALCIGMAELNFPQSRASGLGRVTSGIPMRRVPRFSLRRGELANLRLIDTQDLYVDHVYLVRRLLG